MLNFLYREDLVEKTGAQIVIDFLRHHDIDTIFGYPGGAILPIYDELYKAGINHILVRHEQGAIHAAEGYAKATGKVGVCFSTSGPGSTNIITGLCDAKLDSVPILAITGQVASHLIGTDGFQEADIFGISIPVTKFNNLVRDVDKLASTLEEAMIVATSGRPGPALVDIPKDVQLALTKNTEYKADPLIVDRFQKVSEIEGDIDTFIKAINDAERPLLYVGGGAIISNSHNEIKQLAEKGNIPVVLTLMGLGALPVDHDLCLGMLGMHGTKYANYAVSECDLLISLGARFDDRVTGKLETFAKQAKIAHVDIDRAEINKLVDADYSVAGDLKSVLLGLLSEVKENDRSEWVNKVQKWKKEHPLKYYQENSVIKPQYFLQELNKATNGNAILSTEVGQHQMWSAQYYNFRKPRHWLTSGGLGTMGFGFPAAMGAKLGCPNETVITIAGDASFQMNLQELGTIAQYGIDVKTVIMNNGFLGMVRQWQEMFHGERYSHSQVQFNPDFIHLAEAYGLKGKRITKPEEVHEGIDFLLNTDGAVILEVVIPEDEKVFPMVPAGASINEMIDIDDVKGK